MGTWLLGAIGGLGLALALVGLYGVMSYTVNRRTPRDRSSDGARRVASPILWMVLRTGLGQVATGVGIGTAISLAAARPLAFLMSGITTADPVTSRTPRLLLSRGSPQAIFRPGGRRAWIR